MPNVIRYPLENSGFSYALLHNTCYYDFGQLKRTLELSINKSVCLHCRPPEMVGVFALKSAIIALGVNVLLLVNTY